MTQATTTTKAEYEKLEADMEADMELAQFMTNNTSNTKEGNGEVMSTKKIIGANKIMNTVQKNAVKAVEHIAVEGLSEVDKKAISDTMADLWALSADEQSKAGLNWVAIETNEYIGLKEEWQRLEIASHTYELKDDLGNLQSSYKSYICPDGEAGKMLEYKVKCTYSFGGATQLYVVTKELVTKQNKCEIYGASAEALISEYSLEEFIPVMVSPTVGIVKLKGFLTDDGELLSKVGYKIECENTRVQKVEL